MQNILARITRTKKLIIGITLLVVAAALLYFTETKKATEPPPIGANTNSVTTIDTSDWKTYSQPALGIEFRYPASWYISNEHIGNDPGNEDPYWRDIEGKLFIMGPGVNFEIRVKKSDEPLSTVKNGVNIYLADEGIDTTVSGWPAIVYERQLKYSSTVGKDVRWQAKKKVLINRNNTYYYIDSTEGASEKVPAEDVVTKRETVLSSLKIY